MCHTDGLVWSAREIASMALPAARERHAKNVWHIALREGLKLTLYLNTFTTFFLDPECWKIYRSVGLTARQWHGVSPRAGIFFLKSGSEKNILKTSTFISLTHAGSYSNAPSVMSLPLRTCEILTEPQRVQVRWLQFSDTLFLRLMIVVSARVEVSHLCEVGRTTWTF